MLKHRLIFGTLMIAALLLIFWADAHLDTIVLTGTRLGEWVHRDNLPKGLLLFIGMLVLIALGAREISAIFRAKHVEVDTWLIAVSGMVGCSLVYMIPQRTDSQMTIAILCTALIVLCLVSLVRYSHGEKTQGVTVAAATTMFALVYMGLLPGFFLAIRRWDSAWLVAGIILITKSCDIGAYATGRLIGRHKLIPWLSPGKTWEGLSGGVLFAALVALGLAALGNRLLAEHRYPLTFAFICGIIIGLMGQFGDLVASLLKRDAGIKDSGKSIPGFGGLLDVLDSPIAVAPLAYWLLQLMRQVEHWP